MNNHDMPDTGIIAEATDAEIISDLTEEIQEIGKENASILSENAQLKEQLKIHIQAINELKNVIVNLNVERMQEIKR